jgi:PKD repeat protein
VSTPWDALASPGNADLAVAGSAPPGHADMSHAGNADLAYAGTALPPWLRTPPDAPPGVPPDPEVPPEAAPPPVASFTYDPPDPGATVMVTFDGSASTPGDPVHPVTAWDWLMNNAATRSGQVVTWRTPNGTGAYPVTLTVTAADAQQGTETQVITVPAALDPAPEIRQYGGRA